MYVHIELSSGHFSSIDGSGAFDRRAPGDAYGATVSFSVSGGTIDPIVPYTNQLFAVLEAGIDDDIAAKIGLAIDTGDVVFIPLATSHGPNMPTNEGQWGIVCWWNDSEDKLYTAIYFQGLEGTGDGTRDEIPDTVLSFDQISSTHTGMRVELPFRKFLLAHSNSWSVEHDPGTSGGQIEVIPDNDQIFGNPDAYV